MKSNAQRLLESYLKAQNGEFKKLSKEAAKKFKPGTVHHLRSCCRRLRSALYLLRDSLPHSAFLRINRKLRGLGHKLGEIRQLDVAAIDAKSYGLKVRHFKIERRQAIKKAQASVSRKSRKDIHRKIGALIAMTDKFSASKLRPPGVALLRQLNDRYRRRDLHKLRIAVKKARYVLESLEIPSEPLAELQESMGRIHDLKVLRKLAGRSKKAETDLKAFKRKAGRQFLPALEFAKQKLT